MLTRCSRQHCRSRARLGRVHFGDCGHPLTVERDLTQSCHLLPLLFKLVRLFGTNECAQQGHHWVILQKSCQAE